jgi:hypothetical protein
MYVNRSVELTSDNMHRFQCFIVFDPSSSRISDSDILVRGEDIIKMYEKIMLEIESSNTIKNLTLKNRLSKVGQMLDLLVSHDNLILTRFFDRIWRRYSYVSNISELFLDYPSFIKFFPEFVTTTDTMLAQRIDGSEDDEEGDDTVDDVVVTPKASTKETSLDEEAVNDEELVIDEELEPAEE